MEARREFFGGKKHEEVKKSLKEVKIVVRDTTKGPDLIDEFLEYDSVCCFHYANNLTCFVFERQKKEEKEEVSKVMEEVVKAKEEVLKMKEKPKEIIFEARMSRKRKNSYFRCDFCDFDCMVKTIKAKKSRRVE